MSLRLRSLQLVCIVVIPSLLAAVWAAVSTYQREKAETSRVLRETVRALAMVVDREIGRREAVALTLAASPALAEGDDAALHRQAAQALASLGGWLTVFDARGQRVNTLVPFGTPLTESAKEQAEVLSHLRQGRTYVSDLLPGPISHRLRTLVAVPGQGPAGPVALSVALQPEHVLKVIEEQRLPPQWIATVIDRQGRVVARFPDHARWVGQQVRPDMRERLAEGSEGEFHTRSLDGQDSFAFYSRSPRSGWILAIGVPDEVFNATLHRTVLNVGIAGLVLVLISLGVALAAVRALSDPIRRILDSAHSLRAGETVTYEPVGIDELDEVGRTLVAAGERQEEAQEHLRRRVEEAVEETRRVEQRLADSRRLEAVGRLTGGVAHDVNNLLAVVANNVAILTKLPPDHHGRSIAAIMRAVDTGRRLTQKLLSFTRKRANAQIVVDLVHWLDSSLPLLRTSVGSGVQVQWAPPPGSLYASVDVTDLEVALVNLVVNASDAMGGEGTVRIEMKHVDGRRGGWIDLSVSDQGRGMSDEVLARVFEPFFTTKDENQGAGLGLPQVQSFCRQSGGEVMLESTLGQGTRVTMRLPVSDGAVLPPPPPPAAPQVHESTPRILYVEDNADLADTTRLLLESSGYRLDWAATAAGALELLGHHRYDLVLTDIVLPGEMNGLAFGHAVRARFPHLPVILMTGYAREWDEAMAAGFAVLTKPCMPDELIEALVHELHAAGTPA